LVFSLNKIKRGYFKKLERRNIMETKKTTRSFVTRLFCFRLFSSRSKEEVETSKKEEAKSENSEKEESEDDKNRFFEECRLEWKSTIEDL